MSFTAPFRSQDAARFFEKEIKRFRDILKELEKNVRVMEVCGTHTMAIARFGIRQLLDETVTLISGPGCPVCVTDPGYIDAACALAKLGCIVFSFGDLLRVPGSMENLASARASGSDIRICYSPSDALKFALENPEKEVVFLGIGFETTAAPICAMIDSASQNSVRNLSVLTALKGIPPAIKALLNMPDTAVDGFLLPAHVSAIIGAGAYQWMPDQYGVSAVVAGFEPLDILYGLVEILNQTTSKKPALVNQYSRVVRKTGNEKALKLMDTYLEVADASWRGIGEISESGFKLRKDAEIFDAEKKHGVVVTPGQSHPGCKCGEVLVGRIRPFECALFGKTCTPSSPVGPCMVSSEGSCAAAYRYERMVS